MKEIQKMTDIDLATFIKEKRDALQKMRFGGAGSGMRDTRSIRNTRREIARALTEHNRRAKVGA
ncbi:MAG TPA: 50S ribosomal protein L29 [Candidatus Paceibacterota bacterium]|nr:50S ribosomal protein L29 [Candidatus Paceibacterota bacterium]